MKDLLLQYANYNIWANNLIIDTMLTRGEEQVDREIMSSFPSLRKTVYHTWGAEYVWVQRLKGEGQPIWLPTDFKGSFAEACQQWQNASIQLKEVAMHRSNEVDITRELAYEDLKKNKHTSRMCDMLHHVFNHSTYHRGQMVTILRQLGVTAIPATDLIAFTRGR